MFRLLAAVVFTVIGVISFAPAYQRGPARLFDGKTFKGWEGNLSFFRIEDRAIVAGTMKDKIPRNEFLCTREEYGDFVLHLKFRLLGDPAKANAGVQFRSKRIPNDSEVIGYQADMGQNYWGALYDESRRKRVLVQPPKEVIDKVVKHDDWNDYVIRCEGPRIRLWLNGTLTVDYTEKDEKIERTGIIGLQIHGGAKAKAYYKNITIVELPAKK